MEENNYYFMRRNQVPPFGSWDYNFDNFSIPFTECFESLHDFSFPQDSDLYVTGDLYQNDIVTPAMIVVPRRRKTKASYKEARKDAWVMCDCEKEEAKNFPQSPSPKIMPKAVDEDLYKISPDLLYAKTKRKGVRGFIYRCLQPVTCS